jgi:uncharacterized membrane protein YsdA (DUF1294 family)/cold shock CspA family protein
MQQQGSIIRWDSDKGYGFIRSPQSDQDIFFHVRDVRSPGAPQLEIGLRARFEVIHVGGKGPRAMAVVLIDPPRPVAVRQPAQPHNAARSTPRPASRPVQQTAPRPTPVRTGAPGVATTDVPAAPVLLLIAFHVAALLWGVWQRRLPPELLMAMPLLNTLTFWMYWRDKHAARTGAWRTREDHLHLLSLLGGWPAAWLAQRLLRHKSRKPAFQATYWSTVTVHMLALCLWLWSNRPTPVL